MLKEVLEEEEKRNIFSRLCRSFLRGLTVQQVTPTKYSIYSSMFRFLGLLCGVTYTYLYGPLFVSANASTLAIYCSDFLQTMVSCKIGESIGTQLDYIDEMYSRDYNDYWVDYYNRAVDYEEVLYKNTLDAESLERLRGLKQPPMGQWVLGARSGRVREIQMGII